MANIEKKLIFEGSDIVTLLGINDVNLNLIESRFKTSIIIRGNELSLIGDEIEIEKISKIFEEMKYVLKKNRIITNNDVKTIIELIDNKPVMKGNLEKTTINQVIFPGIKDAVRARTPKQLEYLEKVLNNDLVFALGPAGTGKTFLAVAMALAALRNNEVVKIVLSRPAVEAGESLGFLPGDLLEKIDPYLKPLTDALHYMISGEKVKNLMDKNIIEITPLAYMRGRTLNNSFIILDEAQNATAMQMKMFLTRLGVNSRAIVTGDLTQIDLPNKSNSGLYKATKILQNINGIEFVYFDNRDVVRHRLVAEIVKAYENDESEKLEKKEGNNQ